MHTRISMKSDVLESEESSSRQREEQAFGTGEPQRGWMQAFYDCIHEGLAECPLVRAVLAEPCGQLQKSRLYFHGFHIQGQETPTGWALRPQRGLIL